LQLLKSGQIIQTYKIALGDNPIGHKQQEGDEKTPEGSYILDWRNSKSAYYKSIHISYPNKNDKEQAKHLGIPPGGDIMIHGTNKQTAWLGKWQHLRDWTNGCIAVSNEEMDEIWAMVKNGTRIEINP
jgi:murein L,D-transpeptidase YafK